MRRFLWGIIISIALTVFLIPAISFADSSVSIYGLSKPVTGNQALTTSASVYESGYSIDNVDWYDAYNDTICGSKFNPMTQYTLRITLKRTDGSVWNESNLPDTLTVANEIFYPVGHTNTSYKINTSDKTKCEFECVFARTNPEPGAIYIFDTPGDAEYNNDSMAVFDKEIEFGFELDRMHSLVVHSPNADDESYISWYEWYLVYDEPQEEGPDEKLIYEGKDLDLFQKDIQKQFYPGTNIIYCKAYSRKYSSPITSNEIVVKCYCNLAYNGKVTYTKELEYNGKTGRLPAVKVKDTLRNMTLIKNEDFKVTAKKSAKYRKNVGTYYFDIDELGYYFWDDEEDYDTSVFSFKIIPKKTSIRSLTSSGGKATIKWYKRTTQTTGYQVRYSKSKTFSSYKTKTIKKNTITSTTIKKLTKGKTYYFKVRTYKTVKGTKYYSDWSQVKSKKIR